jgi:FkbM family methyltransferase
MIFLFKQPQVLNKKMYATYDNFTYYTNDHGFIWHINNGKSEPYPRELDIVKRWIQTSKRSNIMIDVGGHIGTTSLPYSRLFDKVYTYEPNPESYQFLTTNIRINNVTNITPKHCGVGSRSSKCKVVLHGGNNSGCFYTQDSEEGIDVITLDQELYDNPYSIDFIKIDTEGSELYVLQGGEQLIKTYKPLIQVETNQCSEQYFKYSSDAIYSWLFNIGYTIFDSDQNNPFFIYHNA